VELVLTGLASHLSERPACEQDPPMKPLPDRSQGVQIELFTPPNVISEMLPVYLRPPPFTRTTIAG
jgi:hypothetical protein